MATSSIPGSRPTRVGERPGGSPIGGYLESLLARHADNEDGAIATYIPELASVDPSLLGVSLVTVQGSTYEAGDTREPFTIQSMSKPLTYGIALERLGADEVHGRIGVEPSGDAFNEISLAPETGAPLNPMINAGAIACAGLIAGSVPDPFADVLATYSRYAGRELSLDDAVYRSESETGYRNRAIGHMLRSFDVIDQEPEAALDLYFRQCAISVDCRDLATIAATLANGGVNPRTGERAVSEDVVREVLCVMATCGMYDYAGAWLISVGLPAKSGVSGGVLAVLPGQLGIAAFSPRLDAQGNSVRGVAVCRDLSNELALHLIRAGEQLPPPVRASYSIAELCSKRIRHADEVAIIRDAAHRTAVFELQGELGFGAAESLWRGLGVEAARAELVVVDLRRVMRVDAGGLRTLSGLAAFLDETGGRLALTGARLDGLDAELGQVMFFRDLDAGLEWCEDELLRREGRTTGPTDVPLEEHELMVGLTVEQLDRLASRLGTVSAPAGAVLARKGDAAAEIFLVTRGRLSVFADEHGSHARITTLSAGMTFGELAYINGGPRAAEVRADSDVECRTVGYDVLDDLRTSDPAVYGTLMRNLAGRVVASLGVVTREAGYLAR